MPNQLDHLISTNDPVWNALFSRNHTLLRERLGTDPQLVTGKAENPFALSEGVNVLIYNTLEGPLNRALSNYSTLFRNECILTNIDSLIAIAYLWPALPY